MIDTVLLKIPHNKFSVTRYDAFEPNAVGLFKPPYLQFNGQPFIKCINNPSKEDIKQGIYRPRLTIYKRVAHGGFGINLHVELSLPKLIFGNNFDELIDEHFDAVIAALKKQLLLMGILVTQDNLRSAAVHAVHYSKNIMFDDFTTASMILADLEKIKMNRHMDLNRTDFRNQGEAVRYWSKAYEFVLYDKVADLTKSADRAMEQEDRECNLQMNIFEAVRRQGKPVEVLRLELRLKSQQKMKALFEKVGIENDCTLQSLFSKKVSQTLLRDYWDDIYEQLVPVLLQELDASQQFALIAKQRPQWKPQRSLTAVAICAMIRAEGHRKTRSRLVKRFSSRTLERIYKDIKGLDFRVLNKAKPFQHVTKALETFTPLKKADFAILSQEPL
jgi:hypothetical protein